MTEREKILRDRLLDISRSDYSKSKIHFPAGLKVDHWTEADWLIHINNLFKIVDQFAKEALEEADKVKDNISIAEQEYREKVYKKIYALDLGKDNWIKDDIRKAWGIEKENADA